MGERVSSEESLVITTPYITLWGNQNGYMDIVRVMYDGPIKLEHMVEAMEELVKQANQRGWTWKTPPIQLNLPFTDDDLTVELEKKGELEYGPVEDVNDSSK